MIVNHKYKFVFIHIPKCGGTSIRAMYEPLPGFDISMVRGQMHATARYFETIPKYQGHPMMQYPRYAIVRDVFDRVESMYRHVIRGDNVRRVKMPFRRFVMEEIERRLEEDEWLVWPQSRFTDCEKEPVTLLPFEKFEASARVIALDCGIPRPMDKVPHKNKGKDTGIYWTPETREKVENIYRDDMEMLRLFAVSLVRRGVLWPPRYGPLEVEFRAKESRDDIHKA